MAGANQLQPPTHAETAEVSLAERAELAAWLLGSLPVDKQSELAAGVVDRFPKDGPYPLPPALFRAYAARMPLSTAEFVPLRQSPNTGNIEVALTQRPPGDPWWPRQFHLAGVAALDRDLGEEHGDYGYDSVMERIFGEEGEFQGTLRVIGEPHLFHACLRRGIRGPEQTVFQWVEVEPVGDPDKPMVGQFFDAAAVVERPPEGGLIIGHAERITRAAAAFAIHKALIDQS